MMRRIITIAIVLCMLVSAFPVGVASAADAAAISTTGSSDSEKLHDVTIPTDAKAHGEKDATQGNDIITRAAWIQELVKTFDMTVEEAHAPDNYFTDLTGEESYYRDILVAVQFGVVDIPAGEAFYPENAATREFAAQTLNSCLGYLHEPSDGYTFSESDTVTYPDAIQIAINRGWFQLSGGDFLPEQAITAAEKSTMLTDAAATLESRVIDTNYRNTYTFQKDVIEIPQGTDVEIVQNTVTIKNCPKTLKAGDVFVVWYQSVPCAYVASTVTVAGTTTTIAATAVSDGSAVTDADAQGILDTEFAQFVPDAGTEVVYVDEATGIEYTDAKEADRAIAAHQATRGTKKLKTLQLKSTVDLGSGISASVTAKLKDPVLEYKFSSKKKVASVILTADYEVSVEAKAELIDHAATKKLRLGFWGCPGVGGIEVCMVYSLSGSITGSFTGTLCVGAEYQSGAGFSLPKTFKSKGFSFIVEASFKSGLQINVGINDVPCDLMSGQVYAEIGAKGSVKRTSYSDNAAPNVCVHTAMYVYLECGAKLAFKVANFKSEYSREYKIWKDSNSPVRVVHHYEDGKEVCSCTREQTYGDNGYYTVGTSNYWGSGWNGGSGGTGYDRNGNPIPVFEYSVDDDGNATITKYHGTGAAVTIPAMIDGHAVTAIGNSAFYGCTSLQTVSIPDSVTSIGNYAFRDCTNLSGVALPRHLTVLGSRAFGYCKSIKSIEIPKSLQEASAPFGDSGLEKATFEAGTTSVIPNLFDGAEKLYDVTLLDTMTAIGYSAFYGCTSLQTVSIPDSVTSIRNYAFYGCTSLKSFQIPPNLEAMGTAVFQNCSSLEAVVWNDTYPVILDNTFSGCSSLKSFSIPDCVNTIGSGAFYGCTSLSGVTGGKNVKHIFSEAFRNCTSLKSITLTNALSDIGTSAFQGCVALTAIEIPDSVSSIGAYIFDGCEALKDIKLGTGLTEIPKQAFSNCSVLESITLSYRVEKIGDNAFLNDVKFNSVTIPRRTTTISTNAFSYPDRLTVYGVAGTYAETYAGQIGAKFVAISRPATSVSLYQTVLTMNRNTTTQLVATISPADFTDEVAWKTSDQSVATVSDVGVVKAVGVGECTVSVVAGNVRATCKISVVQPVTSISLNKSTLSMDAGQTYQLTASVYPSNAANRNVEWSSSDTGIATVDENGLVTALKKGTAVITAKARDGSGVEKSCSVTVLNNLTVCNTVEQLQSPHPYEINCSDIWQYSILGASQLKVTFSADTSVESGSDYLYIFDGNDGQIGKYTGTELAGKTILVPGNTFKIKLVSDGTYCEYGFCVTSVTVSGQHEHDYTATVVAPTCTEQGYTEHICSCGDSYRDSYVPALGHDFAWVVDREPTDTEAGEKHEECNRCHEKRNEGTIIPPQGGQHTHSYDSVITAPTCTERGYTTHTCSCGDSYVDTYLDPLGHNWAASTYVWAGDYSSITAAHICKRDASHVETENGLISSSVTREATYDTEGEIVYTATFVNPAFKTQSKAVVTPKLERPQPIENPFTDVRNGQYYYDAVLWAVENGVTTGTSATTFSPGEGCTRAQVVTFLWRAAGQPAPASSANPFNDVKKGAYYYNAVLWAVEKGITNGTSDTTFSPDDTCTRAQIVTFLWRYEGQPTPASTNNPFADVKPSAYFGNAVLWAVEKGITNGTSATTFAPEDTCTRAQVVTFLYRDIV